MPPIARPLAELWRAESRLGRLAWTFADQGVVSGGMFASQLLLAWHLPAAEYGTFALLLGGLLTLQLCNATLLFHPMSVRLSAAPADQAATVLGGSLALHAALSLILAALAAAALAALGQAALALPATAYFLAWQAHEGLRRGLLSRMRHRAALWGDAACWLGQAAGLLALATVGTITASSALWTMAGCALLGAALHRLRQSVRRMQSGTLRDLARDYWAIGGATALSCGLLAQVRLLVVPWSLALAGGGAAAAAFQACLNIVNLTNPLMLGLGNIIPQAASRAAATGAADAGPAAWRAARFYIAAAAAPVALYALILVALPSPVLQGFYGAASGYAQHPGALQLLAIATFAGFLVEAVIAYLHGIARVRQATLINLAGAIVVTAIAWPAASRFGVAGGCAAVLFGNLLRLLCAYLLLAQRPERVAPRRPTPPPPLPPLPARPTSAPHARRLPG